MINLYVIRPSQNACLSNSKRKLLTGERRRELYPVIIQQDKLMKGCIYIDSDKITDLC
jgi:hypothetical protein